MKEPNQESWDQILDQINDLLTYAQKSLSDPSLQKKLPENFEETVEIFEKNVEKFQKESEAWCFSQGLDAGRLNFLVEQPVSLPPEAQNVLKRTKQLKQAAEQLSQQPENKKGVKKLVKRPVQSRKNKFKSLGPGRA